MKVYVVYHGSQYEGCSHPYGVYDSKEKADECIEALRAKYGHEDNETELYEMSELTLNTPMNEVFDEWP
jgi:hypothetical protein